MPQPLHSEDKAKAKFTAKDIIFHLPNSDCCTSPTTGLDHVFKTVRMEATSHLQVCGLKDCAVPKTLRTGFILPSLAKTDQEVFVLAGLFKAIPQNHSNLM